MDRSKSNIQPDELFRKKLEQHEEPVGREVWDRLSKKSAPAPQPFWQNKKLLAAAVLSSLVLGGGIWTKNRMRPRDPGVAELRVSEAGPEDVAVVTGAPGSRMLLETNETIPSETRPEKQAGLNDGQQAVITQPASLEKREARQLGASETAGPVVADAAPEIVGPQADRSPDVDIDDTIAGPVAVGQAESGSSATRVLVVYVTPPSHLTEPGQPLPDAEAAVAHLEEKKESKERKGLNRFFRQLKNVKTGEKIDWDELGFNPQRGFANVEYRSNE